MQQQRDAGHAHAALDQPATRINRRPLAIALGITTTFLVVEIIGGILTNSLALLADAGHMATDAAALALSLFAVWLARRPATLQRSFGYLRAEILAALLNAAALLVVTVYIFWEAFKRLDKPPEVHSWQMLVIASLGLLANLVSAWILTRGGGQKENLNIRGALLHVLGDMLGSVGAISAALIMLATGWFLADPLLSAGIGVLILVSAWRLLRETVEILLEATPRGIDPAAVTAAMASVDDVENVHDLHIWTVTSGLIALSGHIEVAGNRDWNTVLLNLATLLRTQFGISHVTLQPEQPERLPRPFSGYALDSPEGQAARRVSSDGAGSEARGQ